MSTSDGQAPYRHRHVVPLAVSFAGVYTSHVKPFSPACTHCQLPRGGEAGFLPISAGKASSYITYLHNALCTLYSSFMYEVVTTKVRLNERERKLAGFLFSLVLWFLTFRVFYTYPSLVFIKNLSLYSFQKFPSDWMVAWDLDFPPHKKTCLQTKIQWINIFSSLILR